MLFRTFSRYKRTMVIWNIVLTIFHNDQISHVLWKIVGSTFQCIVVLQSRGDWPKNAWNKYLRVQHKYYPIKMKLWQNSLLWQNSITFGTDFTQDRKIFTQALFELLHFSTSGAVPIGFNPSHPFKLLSNLIYCLPTSPIIKKTLRRRVRPLD